MLLGPHKYPYAINDNGKPIYIDEVTQENRRDTHYHCYGCGAELYPVLCTKKQSHFRHEADAICDPDKYLHEYAKAEIKRRFDEGDTFLVTYNAWRKCKNTDQCEVFSKHHLQKCEADGMYQIDLKEYYDTCTEEKGYYQELPGGRKKYIADLILTNSQDPTIPQTCIEVWVTHECTADKKKNGGRIIEIKIQTEADAARPIIESDDFEKPIRFHNFRRKVLTSPAYTFLHLKMKEGLIVTETTPCSEGIHYDKDARREIIISDASISQEERVLLYSTFLNQTGITARSPYICSRGKIVKDIHGKEGLRCGYYKKQLGCPCSNFIYSEGKGAEILRKRFKNIKYWHQDVKKEKLDEFEETLFS